MSERATRLPKTWQLPDEWREWAFQKRCELTATEINEIADEFRDYWISLAGQKATKMDWFATWRNWIRNDLKFNQKRAPPAVRDVWDDPNIL